MSVATKILIAIGAIVTLGLLGFIVYQQHELKTQQTTIQNSLVAQQQLVDGIMRSSSQYATSADLAKFASDNSINLRAIQDNLKSLNAQLTAINVVSTTSTGQTVGNLPSTSTGPANPNPVTPITETCPGGGTVTCPNTDPYGYQRQEQTFALNEDFGTLKVPFGQVGFSAWQQNPWSVVIPPRQYNVDTVVGTDENERQTFYNKFTMAVNGQTYTIPVANATTEQQVPTATWSWWNPRLMLGTDGGINITHTKGDVVPSLSLGIMSYGQYKTSPDWSILEVGVGYGAVNKTAEVVVTPFAYNVGKKLLPTLMRNTYLGPSLFIGTDGSIGAGGGIRVGL